MYSVHCAPLGVRLESKYTVYTLGCKKCNLLTSTSEAEVVLFLLSDGRIASLVFCADVNKSSCR